MSETTSVAPSEPAVPTPPTPDPVASDAPPPPATPPSRPAKAGLPPWLPFFLLAAVPALIVGVIVYVVAGGDSGGGGGPSAAGVLDGFFRSSPSPDETIDSFEGDRPPGFPAQFPIFKGSKQVAGFAIKSGQGTQYFVILDTGASAQEVFDYYVGSLDDDPWQVELAGSGTDFTGVQFSRPDNADLQGQVTLHHSDLSKRTTMYISVQDLSSAARAPSGPKPFVLQPSRPLPTGFPNDMPIYKGQRSETAVTDTYFERASGATQYVITFLTKDNQDQVINFYKSEFQRKGWTVSDPPQSSQSLSALGISFQDGPKQEVQGQIQTDAFDDDPSYTKVDLVVQVSTTRGRGN